MNIKKSLDVSITPAENGFVLEIDEKVFIVEGRREAVEKIYGFMPLTGQEEREAEEKHVSSLAENGFTFTTAEPLTVRDERHLAPIVPHVHHTTLRDDGLDDEIPF